MKKIIFGLVAIVAVISFVFLFSSSKKSGADIYLYVESGSVMMKETKESEYKTVLEKKSLLENGSYVKTGKGLAHVVFPNNAVTSLGENAEMQILYEDKNISILQLVGDTYHRVQELSQGKNYEVRTPGTLAAVRGTKFAVSYNATTKKAKVAVTENKVLVSRENATTTKPTEIAVGSLANVDENLSPTATKTITIGLTKNDQSIKIWLDRNMLIDQYLGEDPSQFLENFITTGGDSSNLKGLRERLEKTKLSLLPKQETDRKGSLKEIFARGGSQKCTYTIIENGITSSATIYLSGEKMRVDSQTTTNGKAENARMLLTNNIMYVWGDGMPQGIKMPIPDANTPTSQNTQGTVQMVDLDKEMNYSCSPWSADASYFTPPTNIKFMDMSQMMNQVAPTGSTGSGGGSIDVQAMQCGACDSLPEPDKTACRQAIGCR
ncbi:MAG: hypothetical protein QG653_373 [Patescibacteria group bacterium]|nr:hypothetical protein [Patescibacteria group bacterium]